MHQGKLRFYAGIINPNSKLKNKANRTKLQEDIAKYKKQ